MFILYFTEQFPVDAEDIMKELNRAKDEEFQKLKEKEANKKSIEEMLIRKRKEKMKEWVSDNEFRGSMSSVLINVYSVKCNLLVS